MKSSNLLAHLSGFFLLLYGLSSCSGALYQSPLPVVPMLDSASQATISIVKGGLVQNSYLGGQFAYSPFNHFGIAASYMDYDNDFIQADRPLKGQMTEVLMGGYFSPGKSKTVIVEGYAGYGLGDGFAKLNQYETRFDLESHFIQGAIGFVSDKKHFKTKIIGSIRLSRLHYSNIKMTGEPQSFWPFWPWNQPYDFQYALDRNPTHFAVEPGLRLMLHYKALNVDFRLNYSLIAHSDLPINNFSLGFGLSLSIDEIFKRRGGGAEGALGITLLNQ
ncbi:MAG: hypothetical protein ACPGVV_09305 [Croceimicrobium sp.]